MLLLYWKCVRLLEVFWTVTLRLMGEDLGIDRNASVVGVRMVRGSFFSEPKTIEDSNNARRLPQEFVPGRGHNKR